MNGRYRDPRAVTVCQSLPLLMSLLGGGLRLELLRHLAVRSLTVGMLVDLLEVDQPLVSHDLAQLRTRGLVSVRRDGLFHWYELMPHVTAAIEGDILTLHIRTSDGDGMVLETKVPPIASLATSKALAVP